MRNPRVMPKGHITKKLAESLEWHGKPYDYVDDALPGFHVRVWGPAPNQRAYAIRTRSNGRRQVETLGTVGTVSADDARQRAIEFRGAIKAGRNLKAERQQASAEWTLDDAFTFFSGHYADAKKLSAAYKIDARRLYENQTPRNWRKLKLTEINEKMVLRRFTEITGGTKPIDDKAPGGSQRANSWLALMSRLFTLGIKHNHCTTNPASGIERNETVARERYLSDVEMAALWKHLESHANVQAASLVQVLILTGARKGEASQMRWADIDFNTKIWRKPPSTTKQRKVHHVPLSDEALRVLGKLDTRKQSQWVFPAPGDVSLPRGDGIKSFWRVVRKDCCLPDVRLHDLRHSYAAWQARRGVSLLAIGKHLGHASPQTTMRYAHLAEDTMREQSNALGEALQAFAELAPKSDPITPNDQIPIKPDKKNPGGIVVSVFRMRD